MTFYPINIILLLHHHNVSLVIDRSTHLLLLVLMMLLRPEGLFPSQRRKRELHETEDLAGEDELGASPEHVDGSA